MKDILQRNVSSLDLGKNIINELMSHKINTIFQLCNYSKMELIELQFTNEQVNEIKVKLQLTGLDLKPNHAKKNTLVDKV